MPVKKSKKKKPKLSLAVIFWLVFFCVMALLFLICRSKIKETWVKVFGTPAEETEQIEEQVEIIEAPPPSNIYIQNDGGDGSNIDFLEDETGSAAVLTENNEENLQEKSENDGKTENSEGNATVSLLPNKENTEKSGNNEKNSAEKNNNKEAEVKKQEQLIKRDLYFVKVDSGGLVFISASPRMVAITNSPLTEMLKLLLQGPTKEEKDAGLISLIPAGTRMLSARVDGGTAFINFNENFMFNNSGAEGYIAQIRQVVWTATEFPNINAVQFLIEGRKVDFIGETLRLDKPISRNSY